MRLIIHNSNVIVGINRSWFSFWTKLKSLVSKWIIFRIIGHQTHTFVIESWRVINLWIIVINTEWCSLNCSLKLFGWYQHATSLTQKVLLAELVSLVRFLLIISLMRWFNSRFVYHSYSTMHRIFIWGVHRIVIISFKVSCHICKSMLMGKSTNLMTTTLAIVNDTLVDFSHINLIVRNFTLDLL